MDYPVMFASGNQGKLRELRQLLVSSVLPIDLIGLSRLHAQLANETGLSFLENALIKARHAAQYTDLPIIAEDSGIVVDALDGAPGIYSARYAGLGASDAENRERLIEAMRTYPVEQRRARYVSVLVFVRCATDPTPLVAQGEWEGQVAIAPQGEGGFGYDPIFFDPVLGFSAAQLSATTKNQVSHRGKATRRLIAKLTLLPEFTKEPGNTGNA